MSIAKSIPGTVPDVLKNADISFSSVGK